MRRVGLYEMVKTPVEGSNCECCKGPLRVDFQSLVTDPPTGRPYDDIAAKCQVCGHHQFFLFDVSALFEQYQRQLEGSLEEDPEKLH